MSEPMDPLTPMLEEAQSNIDEMLQKVKDLRKLKDLLTDPDLAEKADQVAEAVRVVWQGEADWVPDFVEDKAASYWPDEFDAVMEGRNDLGDQVMAERLAKIEDIVIVALNSLISTRLKLIITKNDYRPSHMDHTDD